ncbi:hypothetical protein AB0P17_35870 [Streptomyces sp. NPDC088124]|uniref:hypothetical protein n=1 Tax=Streptomyces sp. NPDC088124 TaxID=3154654 RepID=UPI00343A75C3
MADERDAWLDKDAAEGLLRGDPVEAPDEHARARRELLSDALRDMSAVTYANGAELPGEAAALAAFRQAGAAGRTDGAAPADLPGTVRLALAPMTVRTRRRGRPLRRGLVVAVAGCALGGITVAAGATVVPSLFGPGPGPASSVSAGASPRPLSSGSAERGQDRSARPSDHPSGDGGAGRSPVPSSGTGGSAAGAAPGEDDGAAGGARGEADADDDAPAGAADGHHDPFVPNTDPASGDRFRRTVDACRDYRGGAIDPERRKALDTAADGPGGTERYCDRLLDGDPRGGGGRNGGKDRDGHGGKGGNDGNGGKGEEGGNAEEGDGGENGEPQKMPAAPALTPPPSPTYAVPGPEESRDPAGPTDPGTVTGPPETPEPSAAEPSSDQDPS